MKVLSSAEIKEGLRSMAEELGETRDNVQDFKGDVDDMSPDSVDFDQSTVDELPDEDKEKVEKIKTPADAKKVLNEAKKDLDLVIEHLDDVIGQTEVESGEVEAGLKRASLNQMQNLDKLAQAAENAIKDAKNAIRHWAFLKAAHDPSRTIKNSSLKEAANAVSDIHAFMKTLEKAGFTTTSTAIPPTGAKFTGDKWPNGKNPAEVELRNWEAGATEFNKDKKFEDARPNAADENRLNDVDYHYSNEPFVNASLHILNDRSASYWDITDTLRKKRIVANFLGLPDSVGPRNEKTFREFTSKAWGQNIVDEVVKRGGLKAVARTLNAKEASYKQALQKIAAGVEDKATVRKYYADAYGDAAYARQMVEGESNDMKDRIGYKPETDDVESFNKGEMIGKAKDGPGKMSSQRVAKVDEKEKDEKKKKKEELDEDKKAALKAKARKAAGVAKMFAAAGSIPFTKVAIYEKTKELFAMEDSQFLAVEATLGQMPLDESIMKEAHIPDTETGIVGNSAEGVRQPSASVSTEDFNPNTKSDAKISKSASQVVPQSAVNSSMGGNDLSSMFTTTASKLEKLNVSHDKLRLPVRKTS